MNVTAKSGAQRVGRRARRADDDEHLTITRKTITALADRLPAHTAAPDLPEHPDYPRILAVFNGATNLLRARDVCEALDRELLPKNIEGTRAKLKHLVRLDVLTEADAGSFSRGAVVARNPRPAPCLNVTDKRT
ncbi:hypothetical protein [Streptomyces sp. 2A115]|uniref:hypothetical protein n=1 Tax=Streptomyces sp. 2A115 TaxID=3457439 RepID=UPI003FD36651